MYGSGCHWEEVVADGEKSEERMSWALMDQGSDSLLPETRFPRTWSPSQFPTPTVLDRMTTWGSPASPSYPAP